MEKTVVKHYSEIPAVKFEEKNYPFTIKHNYTDSGYAKKMSSMEKRRTKGLFTVVYNHHHYVFETQLNYRIPVNQFINSLVQYGRGSKVTEKLGGRQLELTIEELPRKFEYHGDEKNYLLMASFYQVYIQPSKEKVRVSYVLRENGSQVKSGSVELPNSMQHYNLAYFQTWWGAINDYLTFYDGYFKTLGRNVLDKILLEI